MCSIEDLLKEHRDKRYDLKIIEEYAQMGSKTAIRMRSAINDLSIALKALQESRVSDNTNHEMFVNYWVKSFRTDNTIALIPPNLKNKMKAIVKSIMKCEIKSKSELDINARICYAFLIAKTLSKALGFLNQCIDKYPKEYIFHQYCGRLYGYIEELKEGLNHYNKALQLQPNNCHLLYDKANHLWHDIRVFKPKDAINAYLKFLEIAPKDHRRLPEAYYAIALLLLGNKVLVKDLIEIIEIKCYYEKGLESEKDQLPFLLPYQSERKPTVEEELNKYCIQIVHKIGSTPQELTVNMALHHKLSNDNRIDLILRHRLLVSELEGIHTNCVQLRNTGTSSEAQNVKKTMDGLKEITLRDMKQKLNHVFEGYFMKITFIEDSFTGLAFIRNVLQDQNEDIQRCFIYNFKHVNNESTVEQTFGFGSELYLINPQLELASDGRPAIRIDDTNCLIESNSEPKVGHICRYCLQKNVKSRCARCQRAYYCDQSCQTKDWKLKKHKIICK